MSFDEHDGSTNEIKTLYHGKTKQSMVKHMNLLQDMNEHLVLSLIEVDKESTYEDLKEEVLEEMLMGSLINGDMGYA